MQIADGSKDVRPRREMQARFHVRISAALFLRHPHAGADGDNDHDRQREQDRLQIDHFAIDDCRECRPSRTAARVELGDAADAAHGETGIPEEESHPLRHHRGIKKPEPCIERDGTRICRKQRDA